MLLLTAEPAIREPQVLEQLLSAVAQGESEALGALYARTHSAVYALALGYLGSREQAEDVMQETYLRVWEAAPAYRAQGSPMAWLLTIARNLARMQLRAGQRLTELDEPQWLALPDDAPGLTSDERLLLQDALARLEPESRRIVLLHAAAGLKHREIAALLELPLATVLSRHHRAMKKLKALLRGDDSP